jgi:hypothetical protein
VGLRPSLSTVGTRGHGACVVFWEEAEEAAVEAGLGCLYRGMGVNPRLCPLQVQPSGLPRSMSNPPGIPSLEDPRVRTRTLSPPAVAAAQRLRGPGGVLGPLWEGLQGLTPGSLIP